MLLTYDLVTGNRSFRFGAGDDADLAKFPADGSRFNPRSWPEFRDTLDPAGRHILRFKYELWNATGEKRHWDDSGPRDARKLVARLWLPMAALVDGDVWTVRAPRPAESPWRQTGYVAHRSTKALTFRLMLPEAGADALPAAVKKVAFDYEANNFEAGAELEPDVDMAGMSMKPGDMFVCREGGSDGALLEHPGVHDITKYWDAGAKQFRWRPY